MKKVKSKSSKKKKTSQTSSNRESKRSTVSISKSIVSAPVAVTSIPRHIFSFSGGSSGVSHIKCCVPLFQLATGDSGVFTTTYGVGGIRGAMRQTTGGSGFITSLGQTLLFNPVRPMIVRSQSATLTSAIRNADFQFSSGFLDNYSACFTQYRISSLRLIYYPQQNTTSSSAGRRFVLTWSSDPYHPVCGLRAFEAAANAQANYFVEPIAMSMTTAVPFAPWLPFSINCEVDSKWRDTYCPSAGGIDSSYTQYDAGTIRSNFAGALSITCDTVSTLEVQGYMFAEMTLEYKEPNVLVQTSPNPAYLRSELKTDLAESKESVKDKFDSAESEYETSFTPPSLTRPGVVTTTTTPSARVLSRKP